MVVGFDPLAVVAKALSRDKCLEATLQPRTQQVRDLKFSFFGVVFNVVFVAKTLLLFPKIYFFSVRHAAPPLPTFPSALARREGLCEV